MFEVGDVICRIGWFDKFIVFNVTNKYYDCDKILYDGRRSRTYYVEIDDANRNYIKVNSYGRNYTNKTRIQEGRHSSEDWGV